MLNAISRDHETLEFTQPSRCLLNEFQRVVAGDTAVCAFADFCHGLVRSYPGSACFALIQRAMPSQVSAIGVSLRLN